MTEDATADASALAKHQRTVQFDGQPVTVSPLEIGQILQVAPELSALIPAADRMLRDGVDESAAVLDMIATCGPSLLVVVEVCTGVPQATLRASRDVAGLCRLAAAVVGLNASFFGDQLGEIREAVAELVQQLLPGGQTPSTPLSAPATA